MSVDKKGTVMLTTQKIILAVVLILLLALVVYGVSVGGFKPMKEKLEGAYDEVVLLMSSWGEDSSGGEGCKTTILQNYDSDSNVLLDLFEVSSEDASKALFKACQDRICEVTIKDKAFRFEGGKFYEQVGGSWIPYDFAVFNSEEDKLRFYRSFYSSGVELVLSALGASKDRDAFSHYSSKDLSLMTGLKREPFILWAYEDLDEVVPVMVGSLEWVDGEWRVEKNGQILYKGKDSSLAVDAFYSFAHTAWYKSDLEINGHLGGVERSFEELVGGNDEFDSSAELEKLKVYARDYEASVLEKSRPSDVDLTKLSALIEGKVLEVEGKVFSLSLGSTPDKYPMIVFSSDNELYGLGFASNLGVWQMSDSNPLGLYVFSEGNWNLIDSRNFYKITSKDFEEVSKVNKVYDFMEERC
jgi:hypothetical protein